MAISPNEIYIRRAANADEQKQYGVGQNIDVGIGFAGDKDIQRDIDVYKKAGYQILNEPTAAPAQQPTQPQTPSFNGVAPGQVNPQKSLLSQYQDYQMPDAEKIRQQEEQRQQLQAQTQALNTLYDEQLNQQRQVYQGLSGQQRALAARGGILGAPRDEAQQIGLSDKQQKVEGVINAERTNAIANLNNKVAERADERLKAERDYATTNRNQYITLLKEQQAQSRQDVITTAQGGTSLSDLTTEQYQKLLNDSGLDDFALKATFAVNNPKSKAQFAPVGDKLVGYFVNPNTGQFETFESAPIPGLSGTKDQFDSVKEFGGVPYVMTKDADGNVTGKPLSGYVKPEEKQTGAPAEYEYYKKQEEAAGRTPLSFDEYQTQDANRKARAERAGDILTTKDTLLAQTNLRKEFNALPVVKDFNDVKASYARVNSAYQEALSKGKDKKSKAAADQVLIVAFNKLIDPGSTVREGEYARSTEGQSLVARLKGKTEAALQGGTGLTDEDRNNVVEATKRLYTDYLSNYNELANEYRGYASDYGADPDKIAKQSDLNGSQTQSQGDGWF